MFNLNQEPIFSITADPVSHPRTPTLPTLPDQMTNSSRYRSKRLNIVTTGLNPHLSPGIKTSSNRKSQCGEVPVRRNLFSDFPTHDESKLLSSESPRKRSMRSLSTSSNDKGKYYLHEINSLNMKIRNLIKEQETMRDKLIAQESFIQGLQKEGLRPVYSEVQSATIPEHSIDDCYFNVTFKPQEKWLPRSRKFPREVFTRPIKNK